LLYLVITCSPPPPSKVNSSSSIFFCRGDLACNIALDAVSTVAIDRGDNRKEIDIKNYAKVEKVRPPHIPEFPCPCFDLSQVALLKDKVTNVDCHLLWKDFTPFFNSDVCLSVYLFVVCLCMFLFVFTQL